MVHHVLWLNIQLPAQMENAFRDQWFPALVGRE